MTTPRRRSSRLRGVTPAKSLSYATNRLQSLAERDETPNSGIEANLDAIVSSPLAPRTPATAGIKPSRAEMHPSKTHQSTTQEPDSGLRLGFTDIKAASNDQPSGLTQQTPTKLGISSPTFDFKFARPAPQLGPEAQRMMDDLREEALRIKAKLAAEREEENRRNGESAGGIGGRKIAQPRGKVGRFSDIHMAEFKKMDSIAGHPSAFRAQPGRFTPVQNNLKRTQSKAQLDGDQETTMKHEQSSEKTAQTDRLENTAPAKRARKHVTDDTSSARPASSHENKPLPLTPSIPRTQSSMLASISTPTQASLARAATTKKPSTQIPTLTRSPSKPNMPATPRGMTKSATTNDLSGIPKSDSKAILHSPSKFDRVRSILRRPSSSVKKAAQMPSSIPTLARSPSKPNFEKSLPSIPTTPGGADDMRAGKHVNFTPDTVNKHASMVQNSPSPMKSGIPRSTSRIQLGQKPSTTHTSSDTVYYPSVASLPSPGKQTKVVEYPSLAGVRPLPQPPRQIASQSPAPPCVPGTFTFRSDHTISFGSSPKGFGSSPGQSSVRQVRQSIFPGVMPGSFPTGNKENTEPLPAVPHGMANKKRRRADSDDETEEEVERSPKKHKAAEGSMLMAPDLKSQSKTPQSRTPSPAKKKGVLSLSRLNMLARPKVRK
ncbi:uncharacterized protein LY89DRAFT_694669 [Mollisia scopiformis]|uniref:Uncharacterized protein n=1 Tax=Mollisia scopiformis TaxID=149040 RepID=A0A194XLK1_MOLSC|nr:uncharacterized protein LY89DRAFT_694669 [Mollisia scopiformis]KUJ21011.1 hypothetical protein LY89DRAFT_694669 [Mollisia scopiformis]